MNNNDHHNITPDPLPPDRSTYNTEQRDPRTRQMHTLPPDALVDLLTELNQDVILATQKAKPALTALIKAALPGFSAGGRIVYIGAGTSGRLGVLDASEAPPTFCIPHDRVIGLIAGGHPALTRSSEGLEDQRDGAHAELNALKLNHHDTVIGIAAGGSTPYVHGALEYAHALTAAPVTALICCCELLRPPYIDHIIYLPTGPEPLTGSTRMKAGTATKLTLNTLSTSLMTLTGRVHENLMVDMKASNNKLRDRAARTISTLTGLTREKAFALLDQAQGETKTAILMHQHQCSYHTAHIHLSRSPRLSDHE